jgi:hypothetical protein
LVMVSGEDGPCGCESDMPSPPVGCSVIVSKTFSVWTELMDGNERQPVRGSVHHPERNAIGHTHARASSGGAKAWEPMASSSVQ